MPGDLEKPSPAVEDQSQRLGPAEISDSRPIRQFQEFTVTAALLLVVALVLFALTLGHASQD
jgi:hypothetical protein